MAKEKALNWNGIETMTTDTYYDIVNGYFTDEIKDEYTKKELLKAITIINSLEHFLQENDLVG